MKSSRYCAIESVHGRELTVAGFHPVNITQPDWGSRLMSEYFQP